MKIKISLAIAVILSCFMLSGCGDDDNAPVLGAQVKVTLDNILGGDTVSGRTIYMFTDTEPTSSTLSSDAKMSAVTDSSGVAVFNLNFYDLNLTESSTNLYFAIFYNSQIGRTAAVTVKRNDEKQVTINALI